MQRQRLYADDLLTREYIPGRGRTPTWRYTTRYESRGALLAGAVEGVLGSHAQAQSHLSRFVERVPGHLFARKLLIESLLKSGQTQRAIEVLQPGLKQAPKDGAMMALAGEVYLPGVPIKLSKTPGKIGPVPMPGQHTDEILGDLLGYDAIRLLVDRARAVRPGFVVTSDNASAVARICRVLDGMPLAIELAAARMRTVAVAQLAERLDDRFQLLTGGSRTAVPRHQTLRAVVDWSWELLSDAERVLLGRIGPGAEAVQRHRDVEFQL